MSFSGKDEIITCSDCGQTFTFNVAEQNFYVERGFADAPKRCKTCRTARKAAKQQSQAIQQQQPVMTSWENARSGGGDRGYDNRRSGGRGGNWRDDGGNRGNW